MTIEKEKKCYSVTDPKGLVTTLLRHSHRSRTKAKFSY